LRRIPESIVDHDSSQQTDRIVTVHPEETASADVACACRACGAPLEVRVRFQGTLVWAVNRQTAGFGDTEPELRGNHNEPRLVCSADVIHETGFQLADGEIVRSGKVEK
jgi:hypothetical protein